jgi:hypothetical protein
MDNRISKWKIIKTDYWVFFLFTLLIILIGTLGTIYLTKGLNFPDLAGPILFALLGLISVVGVFYRIRKIQSIFEDGIRTAGTINNVFAFRDRIKVVFLYEYLGQRYMTQSYLLRNGKTKQLLPGQSVVVIHKSRDPKSAVIESLYTKEQK